MSIGAPYVTSITPLTPMDIYAHCISGGGDGRSVAHDVYVKNGSDKEMLVGSESDTSNSPALGYQVASGEAIRVPVSSGDRLFLVNIAGSDITAGKVYVMVVTH
jgi:hypothetical protein